MRRQRYEVRECRSEISNGFLVWDRWARGSWQRGIYVHQALPVTGFISERAIAEDQANLLEALAIACGMVR